MDRRKLLRSAISSAVGLSLLAGTPKANGAQIASAPDASVHTKALLCDFIETAGGVRIVVGVARNKGGCWRLPWRERPLSATI
jgi:hypothetical protein